MTTVTSLRNLADWLLRGSSGVAIGRAVWALLCKGQTWTIRGTHSARETALSQRQMKVGTGRSAEVLANDRLAEAELMVKHQERLISVLESAQLTTERAEALLASFRAAQTAIATHQEQLQQCLERSAETPKG